MNDEKGRENIQDYNDMAVGLVMMNAEKYAKKKYSTAKRVEEAERTVQRKEEKEAD